ncbi:MULTISPECIES: acetoacetate decarboxylase family protein [unclassified Methanoregula]|uniref:acetoacetate decarboxylase family protein n=1 Tax=unclassified Methanoregula TaxID=2649730 RepID=UPI0009D2023B|nr:MULTISPECIES: acetoacetate decarboxylase family protein [unclassified Methanoregula]OPX62188.1 MAG: acetoacetate decarboxylase [Methanoregula sp. PtaB.Bin085]OPY35603.1 MAG: acetoacetate decarboxylase [Methanoregula sp. PtaU1.Bin006]
MRINNRDEKVTRRMPAHFRQWMPAGGVCPYDDCTTIEIRYTTDAEKLRQYVPEEFAVTRPLVMLMYERCCGVQWMGGSAYSLASVSVPVQYIAGKEPIDGVYHLVIWEDRTEPVIGGREEAGMPKVFCDIPQYRRLGNDLSVNLSHEGRTFLEMELAIGRDCTADELAAINADSGRIVQFGWRYIPKVGPFPGPALSEATYYPVDNVYTAVSACTGTVKWTVPQSGQHPTQHGIIAAIAALPVYEYLPGSFRKGSCTMRMDLARALP